MAKKISDDIAKKMGGDVFERVEAADKAAEGVPGRVHRRSASPKLVGGGASPRPRRQFKGHGVTRTPLDEARGEILDLLEEHGFLFRGGGGSHPLDFMREFSELVEKHFMEVRTDGKRNR